MKARQAFLLALLFPIAVFAQEICNNGIDDDGDGLIDLNDPDCPCSTLIAADDLPSFIRNHSFEDRGCCPLGFVSPPFTPPWLDCALGWHQATSATSDYFNECGYSPNGFNLPPPDGDGSVGFFAGPTYSEYVGTCLTYPAPANPLIAGTTYTLSLWISCGGGNSLFTQNAFHADPSIFTDQLPLAIFGYANACVPFPVPTSSNCIGHEPGWSELGRVMVQPAWDWTRVSITFTPAQDIHTIMIGGACDTPLSYGQDYHVVDPSGNATSVSPYFIVDELLLTIAADQVLSPTSVTGNLCAENVLAVAQPPIEATGFQWYLDGVALPGETGTSLNVSGGDYGPGTYTMASNFQGACLMGSANVPPAQAPAVFPALAPASGCAPLLVSFSDTTGGGTSTVLWDLGDGSQRTDSAFVHAYTVPGTYDVSLTVVNAAGCTGDTTLLQAVTVHPPVNGGIIVAPNPALAEDPVVLLTGSGSGIISWWWDLGAGDPSSSTAGALNATFPAAPGDYPVMLVVTTSGGCVDTVHSVVRVIDPGVIEMPNVFSPNGDGQNDRFMPVGYKGAPGQLEVYNRWGQVVFSTRNLAQGWNGGDSPDGTYFYIVTPDLPGGDKLTGHVTLVR